MFSSSQVIIDMQPDSFIFQYNHQPEPGPRRWTRKGNEWTETYPSGKSEVFKIIERTQIKGKIQGNYSQMDGVSGTLVLGYGHGRQFFIPDMNSKNMWLLTRIGTEEWSFLGMMEATSCKIYENHLRVQQEAREQEQRRVQEIARREQERQREETRRVEKRKQELRQAKQTNPMVAPHRVSDSLSASESAQADISQPLSHLTLSLELPRTSVHYDKTNSKNLLGKGSFGAVYVGTWQGNTQVAVKELFVQSAEAALVAEFKNEMSIMASLRHPNIVQLYGVCTQTAPYCMVMEWMHQGSLFKVLGDKNQPLPWSQRERIAEDISQGLAHLHAHHPYPILHRDLKSLNVLLDKNFTAKLADFGLAKLRQESASSSHSSGQAGTVLWMAPELFKRGGKASTASDVYSLAVVFWELASRTIPFADADSSAIAVTWVQQGEREEIPSDTPAHIKVLITECWDGDPQKRPTAAQVVQRLKERAAAPSVTALKPAPHYQGNLESAPAPRGRYQPNLNS